MEPKTIVWKSLEPQVNTIETLQISLSNDHFIWTSYVNGVVQNKPIAIKYRLTIDALWQVKIVNIQSLLVPQQSLCLSTNGDGKWFDSNNNVMPVLTGCKDIDISLTPATNTLPINRLSKQLHKQTTIDVIFIDLINWHCDRVTQAYTQIKPQTYQYSGIQSGFSEILAVDEMGFVIDYPNIFERLA